MNMPSFTRRSWLRAVIIADCLCCTRNSVDVPARNWRCSLLYCSSADCRCTRDASKRDCAETIVCIVLRTSASIACSTWSF